ncbi:MAG: hypothetical protein RIR12_986 [Bacteroidota bacterium]|jgi:hypothetical protein
MFLYCTHSTPRLQYVANFIGNILLGTPFIVTTNRDEYKRAALSKINYSAERIAEEEVWIKPHELLFEKKIKPQRINCFEWNNNKVFFKTEGHLPFDIFAATFYLVSRYEEYLPHNKDEYGRFAHANSLAYKEGFLNQPLINKWIFEFGRLLEKMFPSFTAHHSPFSFLPSYDIDEAYAYKYKPWWKNAGAIIKDILKADFNSASFRLKVLTNKRNDPYDSYKWMDDLHENFKLKPIYFFLVAQKNRVYDKNILPNKPALQQLIKEQAAKYEVGIHPSWQSGDSEILLLQEKNYIAELTGKRVSKSRQHYIRLTIPHTYRKLIAAGITEDYSMGYGSTNGFRASVASPFYWYDLENEEQTNLLIYPFCFMDANAYYEQKLSAQAAYDEMLQYYHEVKAVNGLFITLWHNNFLGHFSPLKQWKTTYVKFIKKIME